VTPVTPASPRQGGAGETAPPTGRLRAGPWRALGAGTSIVGGEGLAACLHPALGETLAAADVITPLAVALILLAAILAGSEQTCERVFRLLRWIANRPEPPGPGPGSGSLPVGGTSLAPVTAAADGSAVAATLHPTCGTG
jgi:hypothetical protein